MLLAFHLFTFPTLEQRTVRDMKAVREEEVEVGKERRKCSVIKVRIFGSMTFVRQANHVLV